MEIQTCDSQRDIGHLHRAPVQAIPAGPEGPTAQGLKIVNASGIADAFAVVRDVRGNQAVLLNCSQLNTRLATRLIDICSGGVCAMDGRVHRISAELVLFAPALTRVNCA